MAIVSVPAFPRSRVVPSFGLALTIIAIVTVVRLVGLHFSVVDLFYDESQYWAWSRELAFGYFSKPPLLAWIIALSGHVCGSSEACVRAPAPILYFGTSLLVYAIARQLYDTRVAFFAALSIALATGVAFSARIASTDVPLLFFWSLALFAYVKLLAHEDWGWGLVLGLSLGLGMLAKYAMIYFLLGIMFAAWLDRDARRLLLRPTLWFAFGVGVLLLVPNFVWNAQHSFDTLREVGNNARGNGLRLDPMGALEFVGSQFAVFGPIVFSVMLFSFARIASPSIERADRLMIAFALPPLVIITALGFLGRANANWAATAFISGVILAVALLLRRKAWNWLAASIACGILVQVLLLVGDAMATRLHLPIGGDIYHRTLGWRSLGEQVGQLAQRVGARTIVVDGRAEAASLLYYWRDRPQQILAWRQSAGPENDFEITHPLTDSAPQPFLYVTTCPSIGQLTKYFADAVRVGQIVTPTGPTSARSYWAFKLSGPRGPIPPGGGCAG